MKYYQRALLSLKRKKGNAIILLLIVFVLANVLLTTLAITHSINKTKSSVLGQFKPTVSLVIDYEKIPMDLSVDQYPTITPELVEKIAQANADLIESYDYERFLMGENHDLQQVYLPGNDSSGVSLSESMSQYGHYFTMTGTQTQFSRSVALQEAEKKSGDGFSALDHEQGANKVLISSDFADLNNLEIGSIISMSFSIYDYNQILDDGNPKTVATFSEELIVTGIIDYKLSEQFAAFVDKEVDFSRWYSAQMNLNNLIVPNSFIDRVNTHMNELYIAAGYDLAELGITSESVSPTFILKSQNDISSFIENSQAITESEYFKFVTAQDQYDLVARPLTSMANLLDVVYIITIVASVLILCLVLSIFIYFRQKELGIYLALGERKSRIIGQLLIETILVAFIAATLAIFSSMIFSSLLSESLLASFLSVDPSTIYDYGITPFNPEMISSYYDSAFSVGLILWFYIVLLLTVVFAQMLTVVYLLRLDPKKILM